MKRIEVECVLPIRGGGGPGGECPVWNGEERRLYWIDIDAPAVHRFDPSSGRDEVRLLPTHIGSLAVRRDGSLLIATRDGFLFCDFDSGKLTHVADPEPNLPLNRMNDGRCDARGRFWCGSMQDPQDPTRATGSLYKLGSDLRCEKMLGDLYVSNGLAFSPDSRTMYLSDSSVASQTIWTFDYDIDGGVISNRRIFATSHELPGRPDGACMDADGCYWSAMVDGWMVARFTPDGRIDRTITLPVRSPSMCAFGGDRLDTLYVTSIRRGGAHKDWPDQPLAGGIFACRPGATGLPEPRFAG